MALGIGIGISPVFKTLFGGGGITPASSSITYTGQTPTLTGVAILIAAGAGASVVYTTQLPLVSAPAVVAAGAGATVSYTGGEAPDTGGDAYVVEGFSPPVVADFENEYYRVGGSDTDFATMFTYTSGDALSTMVDSDGLLKWAPHNLLPRSSNLTTGWTNQNLAGTPAGSTTAPDGSTITQNLAIPSASPSASHRCIGNSASAYTNISSIKVGFYAKAGGYSRIAFQSGSGSGGYVVFLLSGSGSIVTSSGYSGAITQLDAPYDDWYYCRAERVDTAVRYDLYLLDDSYTSGAPGSYSYTGDGTSGVYIWGAHLYNGSLGGMVDVPADARAASGAAFATYVPTTTAARYLARRGNHVYNGTSWVNKGLLLETEARTNLVTQSQDFTNAAWGKLNTGSLAIDETGPDGETTAVTFIDDSSTGSKGVRLNLTVTVDTSSAYTFSIFAKADQLNFLVLGATAFSTTEAYTWFNLATGAVGTTGTGQTPHIENCGDGWYRCGITFTTDSVDTTGELRIYVDDADNGGRNVDADGTSSILIYGAQFEKGSTPSSIIPTSGATVTRPAQALEIPAANMSYSATAMSFHIKGTQTTYNKSTLVNNTFFRWFDDSADYIRVYHETQFSRNRPVVESVASSTNDEVEGTNTLTFDVNDPFNLAWSVTTSALNLADDGTALTENSTLSAVPGVSANNASLFYNDTNGNIELFRQWPADITRAGLETAST
jgi:hypothetical protein